VYAAADSGIDPVAVFLTELAGSEEHVCLLGRVAMVRVSNVGGHCGETQLHVVTAFGAARSANHAVHTPFNVIVATVCARRAAGPSQQRFEQFDLAGRGAEVRRLFDDGRKGCVNPFASGIACGMSRSVTRRRAQSLKYAGRDESSLSGKRLGPKEVLGYPDECFDVGGAVGHESHSQSISKLQSVSETQPLSVSTTCCSSFTPCVPPSAPI
jgi:hypothetical protein